MGVAFERDVPRLGSIILRTEPCHLDLKLIDLSPASIEHHGYNTGSQIG